MRKILLCTFTLFLILVSFSALSQSPQILVLGIAQDGGYPHAGCEKECCNKAWKNDTLKLFVVSLALVDPVRKKWWLFEATPDLRDQLHYFRTLTDAKYDYLPNGIFLTHAHIGHYTGLMQLGREVMNSKEVPVFALPRLINYLATNGPWSQLVKLKNISLVALDTSVTLDLEKDVVISAFTVPHRDEFSETAGFKISIPGKNYLFIPDIDKFQKWNKNIVDEIKKVNIAFIDGTFSGMAELNKIKIEEVPHPFISETMELFKDQDQVTKSKVHFIHFNHTNEVLWNEDAKKKVREKGFMIAGQGKWY